MANIRTPYTPLTLNGSATKELLRQKFRFVKKFAKRSRVPESTLSEILSGTYDSPSEHSKSKYQRTLQKIQRAGCLVQLDDKAASEAA